MNNLQKELEAKDTETPNQKIQSFKLKDIRLPKFNLKDKFHNFNNNRAQLLIAYVAAIILFSVTFGVVDTFIDEKFLLENIHVVDYFYFSVVTITTLGYGEILPGTWVAKLMVSALTLFGLYILGMFLTASGNHIDKKDREVKDAKVLKSRIKPVSSSISIYFYSANFESRVGTEVSSEESWLERHIEITSSIIEQSEALLELFVLSENAAVNKVMDSMSLFIKETKTLMSFFNFMKSDSEETFGVNDQMVQDRIKSLSSNVFTLSKAIDDFLDMPRLLVQLNPVKRG